MSGAPMLRVRDLSVAFGPASRRWRAVEGVEFDLDEGEALAIVGESGCGKSLTALALTRLTDDLGAIVSGCVEWNGTSVAGMTPRDLRRLRGGQAAYVFQDPIAALNPVQRVGVQVAEAVRLHEPDAAPKRRVLELFGHVGLPDPPRQWRAYPHELSGGMRQRVVIAMALACRPRLLIADEPTTALDPTVQRQILDLIGALRRELGLALLLVSHDLGVVWEQVDRVIVMYAGRMAEAGPVDAVLGHPCHPYTRALLDSIPTLDREAPVQGIPGAVPRAGDWPTGCRFHPRCPRVGPRCRAVRPPAETGPGNHQYWCHDPWVPESSQE